MGPVWSLFGICIVGVGLFRSFFFFALFLSPVGMVLLFADQAVALAVSLNKEFCFKEKKEAHLALAIVGCLLG